MNRKITYQASIDKDGTLAGKIAVVCPPGRSPRFSVGALTKESNPPHVRTWDAPNSTGIAIDVWADESASTAKSDLWPQAEEALKAKFPGVDIVMTR